MRYTLAVDHGLEIVEWARGIVEQNALLTTSSREIVIDAIRFLGAFWELEREANEHLSVVCQLIARSLSVLEQHLREPLHRESYGQQLRAIECELEALACAIVESEG